MKIDETDSNDGLVNRLKKLIKYRKYYSQREINDTNLVQNIAEELILLARLIIV